jgi:hypothetical protein
LGRVFLSSKGLFFGWGDRRGNFQPLQRGFFESSFGKGMGSMFFFKRGGDLSKGLFLGWSERGGVWLFLRLGGSCFFPFSQRIFSWMGYGEWGTNDKTCNI